MSSVGNDSGPARRALHLPRGQPSPLRAGTGLQETGW